MSLDLLSAEYFQWLITTLVIGGSVYGGIRADIRNLIKEQVSLRESTNEAHKRIDRLYELNK